MVSSAIRDLIDQKQISASLQDGNHSIIANLEAQLKIEQGAALRNNESSRERTRRLEAKVREENSKLLDMAAICFPDAEVMVYSLDQVATGVSPASYNITPTPIAEAAKYLKGPYSGNEPIPTNGPEEAVHKLTLRFADASQAEEFAGRGFKVEGTDVTIDRADDGQVKALVGFMVQKTEQLHKAAQEKQTAELNTLADVADMAGVDFQRPKHVHAATARRLAKSASASAAK